MLKSVKLNGKNSVLGNVQSSLVADSYNSSVNLTTILKEIRIHSSFNTQRSCKTFTVKNQFYIMFKVFLVTLNLELNLLQSSRYNFKLHFSEAHNQQRMIGNGICQ